MKFPCVSVCVSVCVCLRTVCVRVFFLTDQQMGDPSRNHQMTSEHRLLPSAVPGTAIETETVMASAQTHPAPAINQAAIVTESARPGHQLRRPQRRHAAAPLHSPGRANRAEQRTASADAGREVAVAASADAGKCRTPGGTIGPSPRQMAAAPTPMSAGRLLNFAAGSRFAGWPRARGARP